MVQNWYTPYALLAHNAHEEVQKLTAAAATWQNVGSPAAVPNCAEARGENGLKLQTIRREGATMTIPGPARFFTCWPQQQIIGLWARKIDRKRASRVVGAPPLSCSFGAGAKVSFRFSFCPGPGGQDVLKTSCRNGHQSKLLCFENRSFPIGRQFESIWKETGQGTCCLLLYGKRHILYIRRQSLLDVKNDHPP